MEHKPIVTKEDCTFPEVCNHEADGLCVVVDADLCFYIICKMSGIVGGSVSIVYRDRNVEFFGVKLGGGDKSLIDGGASTAAVKHGFNRVGTMSVESNECDVDVHLATRAADEDWRWKRRSRNIF